MKKHESTEKQPFGTGKVIGLSFLCVLLTLLLTVMLLGCLSARRFVTHGQADALREIPLDQVTLSDGTSLAAEIKNRYLTDSRFTESKVQQILRDGRFNETLGDIGSAYCDYLNGDAAFPELTDQDIRQLLIDNDSSIRLHTGIHEFYDNAPEFYAAVQPDLDQWNADAHKSFEKGIKANFLHSVVSQWILIPLGVLLLLVLIWLIVIHVRGNKRVGTAFKTFAVAAFLPSLALFLTGMLGKTFIETSDFAICAKAFAAVSDTPKIVGGLACLACVAVFGLGILANAIAQKPAESPAKAEEPVQPEPPVTDDAPADTLFDIPEPESAPKVDLTKSEPEPVVIRKFCRFCGGELVNNDAKFCYRCGKPQEPTE